MNKEAKVKAGELKIQALISLCQRENASFLPTRKEMFMRKQYYRLLEERKRLLK